MGHSATVVEPLAGCLLFPGRVSSLRYLSTGSPVRSQTYTILMHILLFDIDGTLLTSAGAGKAAIEGALTGEFGVPMRGHVSYGGRTDRAIGHDLFRMHDLDDSAENWQRLVAGYLRRLPVTLASHPGQV